MANGDNADPEPEDEDAIIEEDPEIVIDEPLEVAGPPEDSPYLPPDHATLCVELNLHMVNLFRIAG